MRFAKGDNRDYALMSSILLQLKSRVKLERLRRLAKGDKRNYAPFTPILLLFKLKIRLDKLNRFAKGNRNYTPISRIGL